MLVDLALSGRETLVIGSGDEVGIRARQLAAEGAKVAILSDEETRRKTKGLEFLREDINKWKSVLQKIRPFVVVVSTGKLSRDEKIASYAREVSNLVYVVDRPKLNDINMAGIVKLGDVRIAVSTQGLSPAMAGILRKKIESVVTREDILLVKLQGEVRSLLKTRVASPEERKKLVYKMVRDKKILSALRSKKYQQAKDRAIDLISKHSEAA